MILASCERAQDARLANADFTSLGAEEALEFDAIAARIIPTDETPGASFDGNKRRLAKGYNSWNGN